MCVLMRYMKQMRMKIFFLSDKDRLFSQHYEGSHNHHTSHLFGLNKMNGALVG